MQKSSVLIDLRYKVRFYGFWHCGSGLAAGADVDALVVKDGRGLPFIPGRTMKGLLKEAAEDILFLENKWEQLRDGFVKTFGNAADRNYLTEGEMMCEGCAFFSNAELVKETGESVVGEGLAEELYVQLASTAIGDDGVAKENSLRQMEAVIPMELEGCILSVPEEMGEVLTKAARMVKRIGLNRSRGLGRCDIFMFQGEVV